jgi:hypothetical protein
MSVLLLAAYVVSGVYGVWRLHRAWNESTCILDLIAVLVLGATVGVPFVLAVMVFRSGWLTKPRWIHPK